MGNMSCSSILTQWCLKWFCSKRKNKTMMMCVLWSFLYKVPQQEVIAPDKCNKCTVRLQAGSTSFCLRHLESLVHEGKGKREGLFVALVIDVLFVFWGFHLFFFFFLYFSLLLFFYFILCFAGKCAAVSRSARAAASTILSHTHTQRLANKARRHKCTNKHYPTLVYLWD